MLKNIICSVFSTLLMCTAHSQTEYMINGDFENVDNTIAINPPYPANSGPIYLAPPWNNITNTCDVHHDVGSIFVAGTPHTGEGNGRFVAPMNGGLNEYCYGVTDPLIAGETYIISFWVRKDFSSNRDVPVGAIISEDIPTIQTSPFVSSHSPQMTMTPLSTQYVKGSFCFTAQNNVTHYVSFGPWSFGGNETVGFYLDDVSVASLVPGTTLPTAELTIPQTTYCVGDNVTVDGTLTTDESGYVWEIYSLINNTNLGNLEYSSGIQNGQAGTFDVITALGAYDPGDCYRVILKALGTCEDETFVDFCFADPNIDFIHDGSAICENTPVTLNVTGDNGWTYDWSTGDSGVGLKTLTVTPTVNNSTYSVTVTTPEGCTHTETINLTVHSANNQAPWMNGINGSGDYTIYVNQGDAVSFTSTLFNDDPSEVMDINDMDNIPSNFSNIIPSTSGGNFSFDWQTNTSTSTGEYYFTLIADDKNACSPEAGTFTFKIIVICDYCPVCLYYEDRTPTNNPLPGETKVGQCIEAGISQVVETGNADVLFQAGESITTGNFFSAGPGYQAIIDPSTCVTDCEACCDNFAGFTPDFIPNVFTPNGDGINDHWYVPDTDNPFCAFKAQGYHLAIVDAWGLTVRLDEDYSGCCAYTAPSPSNNIPHSSIYWDGNRLNGTPAGNCEYYFYVLTFYGCGQEEQYHGNIYLSRGGCDGKSLDQDSLEGNLIYSKQQERTLNSETIKYNREISISPNPTSDFITIEGLGSESWSTVLVDGQGNQVLQTNVSTSENKIDLRTVVPGTYYIVMNSAIGVHFNKIVVI
jgi:hypothetical protein